MTCKWKGGDRQLENWLWTQVLELCFIYYSVYITVLAGHVTKPCSKLPCKSRVRTNNNKGLWIPMVFSALFYDWALDVSLSQGDCVHTNKEADWSCHRWFILLFCLPSALDEKLIETLSCLLIPSQTARANHLPRFTTFIIFLWTTPKLKSKGATWRLSIPSLQLDLKPLYRCKHVTASMFHFCHPI